MPSPVSPPRTSDFAPEWIAASAELVSTTREVMLAAGVTDVGAERLGAANELLREAVRILGERTRSRTVRYPFDAPVQARAEGAVLVQYPHNPHGIPLEVRYDGERVSARLEANALLEGPPDSMHGGVSAWVMDNVLGTLVHAQGLRAGTGTLTLRYLRRTPLDVPLELGGEITGRSGRKITTKGWIAAGGKRCVEAAGLFVEFPEGG